jgi:amino acid adenylation domain-containing protein
MLTKENIQDIFILTPMQEAMFYHSLLQPEAVTYFEQVAFRQRGKLRTETVRDSFNILLQRYEVLRAVFVQKQTDRPIQVILKQREIDFYVEDIRGVEDQEAYINAYREQDKRRNFKLGKDVLMRVGVLQLKEAEYEIIWSWHHILIDAWCVGVLQDEFFAIYTSLCQGKVPQLPSVKPYKNYISWLMTQDRPSAAQYWQHYLQGFEGITDGKPEQQLPGEAITEQADIWLNTNITAALNAMAVKYRVTLNVIVKSLWGVLLSVLHGTQDAVFGTVVSGRPPVIEGVESMLGLFINTIPVRVRYEATQLFTDLLKQVQQDTLAAENFQFMALSDIMQAAERKQDLFDHIFLFQNFPVNISQEVAEETSAAILGDGLNLQPTGVSQDFYYPLNVFAIPGKSLQLLIKFDSNKYTPRYINTLLRYFHQLATQVAADETVTLSTLSLLDELERKAMMQLGQGEKVAYPNDLRALLHPDPRWAEHTAIDYLGLQLSYKELHEKANGLAVLLAGEYLAGPGTQVAIMCDRSKKMIVALLAVLKTGAAFVPLDPALPAGRKEQILSAAAVEMMITESSYLLDMSAYYSGKIFALDIELDAVEQQAAGPDMSGETAYILFTSGSTGTPKGVTIGVESFANYLHWCNRYYFNGAAGRHFPFFTPLTFDLTLTSIFTTLLRGDTLFIFNDEPADRLLQQIFTHPGINTIKLTPAHITILAHLPVSDTAISTAIVGGEALVTDQVQVLKKLNPAMRVFNEYGPTEATVGCIVKEVQVNDAVITIGRPIDNTFIYILDRYKKIVPVGVEGEIYIGGKALAKGYIGQSAFTGSAFMPDPFNPASGLYRTGDAGYWLPNGEVCCGGRLDEQLKVRGFRVEPAEIAIVLRACPHVRDAVVLPYTTANADIQLVAYICADGALQESILRETLLAQLPPYMMPAFFISIDEIPLTANGKVNRKGLPDPISRLADRELVAPRNATEAALLEIWKEVLQQTQLSVTDHFFEIGGHSLNATQIVVRIFRQLQVRIELKDLFEAATIAGLAALIAGMAVTENNIPLAAEQTYYPVSHPQKRLWMADKLQENALSYIIPKAYLLTGSLQENALQQAFADMLARHESLRTTFLSIAGSPVQQIHPAHTFRFRMRVTDVSTDPDGQTTIAAMMQAESQTPFQLHEGPLLRAQLVKTAPQQYLFLLTFHHIISDARSMEVFVKEMVSCYNARLMNESAVLPPLRIQYKDYAVWQQQQLSDLSLKAHRDYWLSRFEGVPDVLPLKGDFPRPVRRTYNGDSVFMELPAEAYQQLQSLIREQQCTLFTALLAVLKALLYRYTATTDITVGTVETGRIHPDLEDQVGFYMNLLALRTRFSPAAPFTELMQQVKTTVQEALQHQQYPFDLLLDDLQLKTDTGHFPLFDIVLSLQYKEDGGNAETMHGITVSGYNVEKKATIYDLILDITATQEQLFIDFTYNTDIFRKESITLMGERYLLLLNNILTQPLISLSDISLTAVPETTAAPVAAAAVPDFEFKF